LAVGDFIDRSTNRLIESGVLRIADDGIPPAAANGL
jgi:hypothetical protein